MDIRMVLGDDPDIDDGRPGLVEQVALGAARLASLPFIVLVILLASSCYGLAILVRRAAILAVQAAAQARGLARAWGPPPAARDA